MSQKPRNASRYVRVVKSSDHKSQSGSAGKGMPFVVYTYQPRDPQHVRQGRARRGAK